MSWTTLYETEFRFPRQDRGFRGGSVGADRDTEDKTAAVATEKEEDAENGRAQEEEEEEDEGEGPDLALGVISVKILSSFMFIMCKMIHSLRFFLWKKDRSDWLDSFKYFGLGADHIFSES